MSSLRNQLRPKHQVLILKCYPRFQKNVPEVKPNSSELSYLLYYASTRRSKIQKVGAFLEKKTEADVRRAKVGNVQVTLAILSALIDRTRRDLTLYAAHVLRILRTVLASKRLGLVEDSLATFQAFCEHQDVATFAADQSLIRLYEDIVEMYASFARTAKAEGGRIVMSKSLSVQWRTAGLTALESITKCDAIGVDGGLQLSTIIPVLLDNLYEQSEEHVLHLFAKVEDQENAEKDIMRGRPSTATQRTTDTIQTTDGTTEEADRIAEEATGILALQTLKNVFSSNNRGQIRLATQAMLRFFLEVIKPKPKERPGTAKTSHTTTSMLVGAWPTVMIQMTTRWTPVQDRFVIMVTIMEELVKSPIAEENLGQQLILVYLAESLLSSSINMIGLSVMDVLLGLVQHILLLLQLGGKGSNILPHHQQTDAIDLFGEDDKRTSKELSEPVAAVVDDAKDEIHASATRQSLLDRLRICIGALANHIYYSDQIADMIAAILLRLKPSPMSAVGDPVTAVENPEAAAQAISDSVKMQEDPRSDAFFSFGTARVTALNAIKDILVVANSKASVTGAGAVGRNRVQVQTWEGTQWLLRDEDKRVRRAYVDALTTWLRLEMSKNDLSVMEDREARKSKLEPKNGKEPARALSSASRRSKTAKAPRSTFLQLLHLAIYDNAIDTPEDESEILLLHLLLYHLVEKLGVNAVQHGLPMIVRLQEDINQSDYILSPKSKIVVGSLVHGFFWSLTDRFDFENTLVGHEITSEIQRRKRAQLWLLAISIPPVPLDKIMIAGSANAIRDLDSQTTQNEVLRPFDSLADLVNQVIVAYDNSIASPPTSPPGSPGKTFTTPILTTTAVTSRARELPEPIRDAMLAKWTKAGCLASIENSLTRSGSTHGSNRGTLRSLKNGYLHADTGVSMRDSSPGSDANPTSPSGRRSMRRGLGKSSAARGSIPPSEVRARSPGSSEPQSTDVRGGIVRFGELKRLVDGDAASSSARNSSIDGAISSSDRKMANRGSVSVGSDSMVEAEDLGESDEEDANDEATPMPVQQTITMRSRAASYSKGAGGGSVPSTPRPDSGGTASSKLRTRSSSTASAEDPEANARALAGEIVSPVGSEDGADGVPPVPPLPEGLISKIKIPKSVMNQDPLGSAGLTSARPGTKDGSLTGSGSLGGDISPESKRRSNAQRILSGIDIGGSGSSGLTGGSVSGSGLGPSSVPAILRDGKPPY